MTDLTDLEQTVEALKVEAERRPLVVAGPIAPVDAVEPSEDVRTYLRAGSILTAKDPDGGPLDRVEVRAFASYDAGATVEVVIAPCGEFASPVSVSIEALDAAYYLASDGPEAKPWESDPLDLFGLDRTINDPAGATRILKEKN